MTITRKAFFRLTGIPLLVLTGKKLLGALSARRWAMLIDLPKCLKDQGCAKCIQACHRAHNVPEFPERSHQLKWIWKEPFERAFSSQQGEYTAAAFHDKPVLIFCNHCDNPPCVRVCPTKATWKRDDGIVMMDWHRCIGCRYCVAACPYGSRSFNWLDPRPRIPQLNPDFPTRTRGVVEKCTFCDERLAKGQLPACVEACPEKAMLFGDLEAPGSRLRELLRSRYAIRRKPELGTRPEVFYIL
jgi:Fe-S-cluster-containing dehydrogenase component